ncbi:MAG TPA: hypothetical protein VN948_09635 [Terriglobales bacterium]|nr:hypothetical protein [Terriglobales bacterium]
MIRRAITAIGEADDVVVKIDAPRHAKSPALQRPQIAEALASRPKTGAFTPASNVPKIVDAVSYAASKASRYA